jgi:lysophospholipase L1-like esterase
MKRTCRFFIFVASIVLAVGTVAQPAATNAGAQASARNSRFALPPTDEGLPGAGPIRRQFDWFQQVWVERRSLWAQRVEQDQNALVFLGDSITQLWGDDLGGSFPGVKVANRGISGDTTRGVLIRMKEDVLALHPTGVVLLIGCNDLEDGAEPETIAGNLKLIVAELKNYNPKMPVILCQIFPSSATKKRPADKVKRINQLYAAAVKGDSQVTLVETWLLFANAEGDARPEEFPDLLHPNQAGYAKWAAGLHPLLATLGFMDNEPDNFTPEPGFTSLFNGHDLTGWGFLTNNFDGQTASLDGRYIARNGRLIVMTSPQYRKLAKLSTTREFPKDFTLKLEFRSMPYADSGIFIRQPQLQCRDYLLAGPYKNLKQYKPQDWNEIVITVKDNVAYCTCNGEVLEAAFKVPPTGPIGLEGDRGQMEYRHIRFQETP